MGAPSTSRGGNHGLKQGRRPSHAHAHAESDHLENTGSGILRASIFGVSDGLVSNLALVMGVAGGTESAAAVVLAGSAGLFAGAFSMAAGEYVSMQTQRETMEHQLDLERKHIVAYPDEEQAHLAHLLCESGLEDDVAREMAGKIHERVDPAVDFHALLELGIVPRQMGSPVAAAGASFLSFIVGAAIPLLPWLVIENALELAIVVSAAALMLVGAAATRVTQRTALAGALRQLAFGAAAAGITYLVGRGIGTLI
jgi:VIT1/CCC1 family predicted Fe2+/Mn2+ transporter